MRGLSEWSGRLPSVGVARRHKSAGRNFPSSLPPRNKRHFLMLICHIAVCTRVPRGKPERAFPPNHGPPPLRSQLPFNKSLGEKYHISGGTLDKKSSPGVPAPGHTRTRAGGISIFPSLSEQFFPGSTTGLLQMTSPNDTRGYAVLLLSLLRDGSILISLFVVLLRPPSPSHLSDAATAFARSRNKDVFNFFFFFPDISAT